MALLWSTSLLALGAILQNGVNAQVPTWPTLINDDLEDIMFLNTGYRSRQFSAGVTPCSAPPTGTVGRIAAAEWLRTAFHDMARYNINNDGLGGLDGSLAYEIDSGQNKGPAFNTTITTYEPFMGPYVSLADLIAMGTYTAVRSCGGAPVGIKYGRLDATKSNGDVGTPQPEDGQGSFIGAFNRMGFDIPGMVAVTACGHTIGGVHGDTFPLIVTPSMGCANNYCPMDTSTSVFDNTIAKEYVANTSPDPLVYSAASFRYKRQSDLAVFTADGNVTINKLTDPATFRSTCQTVLQKMIEVVPKTTTLSANTIIPYEVKPYGIQLYLNDGGQTLSFSGDIRVRTTTRGAISKVQLVYKDRLGGTGGTIDGKSAGTANGFDDSFSFFSFSSTLPASSSISSFTVVVTSGSGTETFNNNGAGFPVQDTLLYQVPQSCLSGNSLTVLAAVRNTASGAPNLNSIQRVYTSGLIPPKFPVTSAAMTASNSVVGAYNLYKLTVPLTSGPASKANFNMTLGSVSVPLQSVGSLTSTCGALNAGSNSTNTTSTTTSTTTTSASATTTSGSTNSTSASTTTTSASTTTTSGSTTTTSASATTTSASTTATSVSTTTTSVSTTTTSASTTTTSVTAPSGASYLGCYVDSVSKRTLDGASYYDSKGMTLESCASYCSSYSYFGTEYGQECYCGNAKPGSSSLAPSESDCNMACTGNSKETCGAGDRLSTFTNLNYNVAVTPDIGKYKYQGCFTDSVSARALSDNRLNDNSMTIEKCAAFCASGNYAYFGTEYSSECYCGNTLASTSTLATNTDCNMVCSGNGTESCGGPNRIDLWSSATSKRGFIPRGRNNLL